MLLPHQIIKGQFREALSQKDLRFVVTTLAKKGAEADGLLKLLTDPGTRDVILDSEKLCEAIAELSYPLPISEQLYYYILLRRALRREGIKDSDAAAFLSEGLVNFPPKPRPGIHTADYVAALEGAKDYEWFGLSVELANRTLFLSGMYADTLYKGKKKYNVAGLNYYENLGRGCYLSASRHRLAEEFKLAETLKLLSEEYVRVRQALGRIKESYLKVAQKKE